MQLAQKGEPPSLSSEEFKHLMSAIDMGDAKHIAVAVSGGGDSMALALLLKSWCSEKSIKLTALIVDHGLRQKSTAEASQVAGWFDALDIDNNILKWQGDKPNTNIQYEARKARFLLLGNWCADHDIKHLLLAHHQGDQAETFLIRLFRGSGIDGLSAMEKMAAFPVQVHEKNYPFLCRPLLDVPKEKLIQLLNEQAQPWIEDPSNQDVKYTRIQIRELLSSSEIDGLDEDRLSQTAKRMRRVRTLLEELTESAETDYVNYSEFGFASLNKNFITQLHEEIALRLLSKVIQVVSGGAYPPRHKKLEALYENLSSGDFQGQTLAGSMIFKCGEDEIIFTREIGAIDTSLYEAGAKALLWDNRFIIKSDAISGNIVPLSEKHLKTLSDQFPDFKEKLSAVFNNNLIRDRIMPSLPCIIGTDETILLPDMLADELNLYEIGGFSAVFSK